MYRVRTKRGEQNLRDDLLAVFVLYNERIYGTDGARLDETSLVDVRRFVLKVDEVRIVNLKNLRREVRAVTGSDAQRAVDFDGHATDRAFSGIVTHVVRESLGMGAGRPADRPFL